MTQERCLSLATAVATFCDQQVNQERPLLSATLPSGERIQFVIPPAVPRGTVSITVRKPSHLIKRLDDFEREGLFERTATVTRTPNAELLPFERELAALKDAGRYADFLRLAVRKHQTIVVSGKTGSGKTTFMKGLVEEVPKHERLITIQDTAELTLPNHPNVVHLFYSKDAQGTARVTAKSLLEACLRMKPDRIFPGRGARRRVLLLRAPRGIGPPGQHHQRACRQLRAGLRADVADDPRDRRRRRPAHERDQVAAERGGRRDRAVRSRRARALHLRDPLRTPAPAARPLGSTRRRQHEQPSQPCRSRPGPRVARSRPAAFAIGSATQRWPARRSTWPACCSWC